MDENELGELIETICDDYKDELIDSGIDIIPQGKLKRLTKCIYEAIKLCLDPSGYFVDTASEYLIPTSEIAESVGLPEFLVSAIVEKSIEQVFCEIGICDAIDSFLDRTKSEIKNNIYGYLNEIEEESFTHNEENEEIEDNNEYYHSEEIDGDDNEDQSEPINSEDNYENTESPNEENQIEEDNQITADLNSEQATEVESSVESCEESVSFSTETVVQDSGMGF